MSISTYKDRINQKEDKSTEEKLPKPPLPDRRRKSMFVNKNSADQIGITVQKLDLSQGTSIATSEEKDQLAMLQAFEAHEKNMKNKKMA